MTEKLRILVVTNTYPTQESPGNTPCIKDQLQALKERLNSMAPLKALFVRSPDELVLRVSQLLNDPGFYQTYTDRSVHLLSRHLGLHINAVDALVSISLEAEQA